MTLIKNKKIHLFKKLNFPLMVNLLRMDVMENQCIWSILVYLEINYKIIKHLHKDHLLFYILIGQQILPKFH